MERSPVVRTSQTHPLQIAAIRAHPGAGRIGITFCPGKRDAMASTGAWARDLATDLDAITAWGAKLVLTLVEPEELRALAVPELGREVRQRGIDWRHLPIADYSVPSAVFEAQWKTHGRDIRQVLRQGGDVVVHCKGGLGRAGMIAARLLVELGMPANDAISAVRAARKGAIETSGQLAVVRRTMPIPADDDHGPAVLDTALLQQIGGRLGSNPGGTFEDAAGRRFYVKSADSAELAHNEILTARLYQLAGAPTLTYVETTRADQIATVLIRLDKKSVTTLSPEERRQAQHWFGVHAWTANWDVAGFHGDNQGVTDGVVLTLDLGGALEFRAMGTPKGRAFGTEVTELDSLRTDPDNPFSRALFSDMDGDALREAIAVVTALSDDTVRDLILHHGGGRPLADKMVARKADMLRRLHDPALV